MTKLFLFTLTEQIATIFAEKLRNSGDWYLFQRYKRVGRFDSF